MFTVATMVFILVDSEAGKNTVLLGETRTVVDLPKSSIYIIPVSKFQLLCKLFEFDTCEKEIVQSVDVPTGGGPASVMDVKEKAKYS